MFVEEKATGEVKELDEISHVLLRASALIEDVGLWQDGNFKSKGTCALLAIRSRARDSTIRDQAFDRLAAALGVGRNYTAIARWNDAAGRTKQEVVAKLRAVAFYS